MKRFSVLLVGSLLLMGCRKDDPAQGARDALGSFFTALAAADVPGVRSHLEQDSSVNLTVLDQLAPGQEARAALSEIVRRVTGDYQDGQDQGGAQAFNFPVVVKAPDVAQAQAGIQNSEAYLAALKRVPLQEHQVNVLVRRQGGSWRVVPSPELDAAVMGLASVRDSVVPDFLDTSFVHRMTRLLKGDSLGGGVSLIPSKDPQLIDQYARTDFILLPHGNLSFQYRQDNLAGEHEFLIEQFIGTVDEVSGGQVVPLTQPGAPQGVQSWCVLDGPFKGSVVVVSPDESGASKRAEVMTPTWQTQFTTYPVTCANRDGRELHPAEGVLESQPTQTVEVLPGAASGGNSSSGSSSTP